MSGRRIYVDCYSKYYRAALVEEGKLIELILQDKEDSANVGDIYVGRVDKILPSNIAFVNIGEDKPVFLQIEKGINIKNNQEIVVQIIKEAFDEKCAVASLKIGRTGKYCVVVKDRGENGVSKKICDINRRNELKAIADECCGEGFSVVIRTSSKNAENSDIINEIKQLNNELSDIEEKGKFIKAPSVIYKEVNPLGKAIRDLSGESCTLIINDSKEFERLNIQYKDIEIYEGDIPLFTNFGIESQIEKLFHKKIWLKSGGYIIIDETEAMTVVDVNSGKSVKVKEALKINSEAAVEIARQLRLRNINGMIIVDFINMNKKEDNEELFEILKKEFLKDRIKTNIVGMTELGLMQITRAKSRKPLSKYIYHKCPMCDGLGSVKEVSYVADTINNQIISILGGTIYNRLVISANGTVIDAIEEGCKLLSEKYKSEIVLNRIITSRFDYFEIEKGKI